MFKDYQLHEIHTDSYIDIAQIASKSTFGDPLTFTI